MSLQRRALLIALAGPALQALGLVWGAVHLLVAHWSTALTTRHLIYDPAIFLIVVGFLASLICLPVALEVARASESEVEIPVYEAQPSQASQRATSRLRRDRVSR